ncbi:MAG TPA: ABC transporter ATP-binding protein [Candidatus Acidoferrales bacterium]|nr:ABC transporter ATP-binding protein [Candidatus Acidoferrales bacterium]
MPEAVTVENLTKNFPTPGPLLALGSGGHKRALAGVSFSLGLGEIFGLLGPNGAGKTTLLKILCTLLEPNAGRAAILGFDVVRQAAQARNQLGYSPGTERSFYLRLTARENLRFFGTLNNLAATVLADRIPALLAEVGLAEAADEPVRNYSTGMLQRLALARALLHRPRVLLFDEPTRSLDPAGAAWWRDYVRRELVQRSGCGVLLATHNLAEAEEVCDRLAVLDRGELKAIGTPREICRQAGAASLGEAYAALTRDEAQQEAPAAS